MTGFKGNTNGSTRKPVKIWFAKNVSDLATHGYAARTLKGICELVGVGYDGARQRQDRVGGKTGYKVGGEVRWEIWVEEVL